MIRKLFKTTQIAFVCVTCYIFCFLFIVYKVNNLIDQKLQAKSQSNSVQVKPYTGESEELIPAPNSLEIIQQDFYLNVENISFVRNNAKLCKTKNPRLLLILVHSSRSNLGKREAMRKTMGSIRSFKRWDFRLLFLLGVKNEEMENFTLEPNQDLVIGDFEENYQNVSYKHIMGYKWMVQFCPKAKFILKLDDGTIVNPHKILELLENRQIWNESSILGYEYKNSSVLKFDHKSKGNLDEYEKSHYPDYTNGLGYLIKNEALKKIYEIHGKVKFFTIDDIWITGILRDATKTIQIKNISSLYLKMNQKMIEGFDVRKYCKGSTTTSPWAFFYFDWETLNIDTIVNLESIIISLWQNILTSCNK